MRKTIRNWAFCALALLSVLHAVGQSRLNYTSPCDASTGGEFFFTIDWVKITKGGGAGIKFTFNIKTGNTFRYGNTQFTRSQVGFTDADILVQSSTYYFNVDIYYKGVKLSTIKQATMSAGKDPYNGWGVVEKGYTGFFPDLTSEKAESMFKDAIELRNIQFSTSPRFSLSDNLLAKLKKLEEGTTANSKPPTTKTVTSAPNATNASQTNKQQPGSYASNYSKTTTSSSSSSSSSNNTNAQRQQALDKSKQIEQESYRKLQESSNELVRGLQTVFGNKVDEQKKEERLQQQARERQKWTDHEAKFYFQNVYTKSVAISKIFSAYTNPSTDIQKSITQSFLENTNFTNSVFFDDKNVPENIFKTDLSFRVWSHPSSSGLGSNNFMMRKLFGTQCVSDMIQLLGIKETEIDRHMFTPTFTQEWQSSIIESNKTYPSLSLYLHDIVYNIKSIDKKQNYVYYKIKPNDTAEYLKGAADLTQYRFIEKYRMHKNYYKNPIQGKNAPEYQPVNPNMNHEIGYIDFDKKTFQYGDMNKKYTDASAQFIVNKGKIVGVLQYADTSSLSDKNLRKYGWVLATTTQLDKSEHNEYNSSTGKMSLFVNGWYPGVLLVVTEIRERKNLFYGSQDPYLPYEPGTSTAEYARIEVFATDASIGEYNEFAYLTMCSNKSADRRMLMDSFLAKHPDNLLGLHTRYLIEKASQDELSASRTKAKILKIVGPN